MSNKNVRNEIALARGTRLRFVRKMAGMTLEVFADRCGVGSSTVFCWEKGLNALTKRGAQKVVRAMKEEGISCTVEWLVDLADEEGAKITDQRKLSRLNYALIAPPGLEQQVREALPIRKTTPAFPEEIALFKALHATHLVCVIQDNEMFPAFYPGDWVGGAILARNEISLAHEKNCIIQLQKEGLMVRRVQIDDKQTDKLSFYVTNAKYSIKYPPIYQLPLEAVVAIAPIIRTWREE